jgi:predicted phage terminase large subunit-like protein
MCIATPGLGFNPNGAKGLADRVFADRVTGSKQIRAEPFAAQVQGGNVSLVAGDWVRDFLDEAESFPSGKFKDQIDAASGAFARLTGKPFYDLDAMQ